MHPDQATGEISEHKVVQEGREAYHAVVEIVDPPLVIGSTVLPAARTNVGIQTAPAPAPARSAHAADLRCVRPWPIPFANPLAQGCVRVFVR